MKRLVVVFGIKGGNWGGLTLNEKWWGELIWRWVREENVVVWRSIDVFSGLEETGRVERTLR